MNKRNEKSISFHKKRFLTPNKYYLMMQSD